MPNKKAKKSNNLLVRKTGFSRTRLGIIAGMLGAIGIVAIVVSNASAPARVSCTAQGGEGTWYNCQFYTSTPIYDKPGGVKIGTLAAGQHSLICQKAGKKLTVGSNYNIYYGLLWGSRTTGWVNAVYAQGGANNGAFGFGTKANYYAKGNYHAVPAC